jgi:hypothetical protein
MEKVLKILFSCRSRSSRASWPGSSGRKAFEQMWGLVDDEEPPTPKHSEPSWLKLIAALIVEGAIFRAVRGLVDRGAPHRFRAHDRTWPARPSRSPSKGWAHEAGDFRADRLRGIAAAVACSEGAAPRRRPARSIDDRDDLRARRSSTPGLADEKTELRAALSRAGRSG